MLKAQEEQVIIDKAIAKKARIAIIRTDYYQDFNDNLEKHAKNMLTEAGVLEKHIATFVVPGTWEIPIAVKRVAASKKFDAIITFGVVLKGETLHFEMIANEVGRALMDLSLQYDIPVALEVLAVFNLKQATARASDDKNNKGREAAGATLKILQTLSQIKN